MRGIPKNPVSCAKCANQRGCPKDGLCHSCRILGRPNPRKKSYWTPALEQALTQAYKTAGSRTLLIQNLNRVQQMSGFSRFTIQSHAAELRLSYLVRRPWSKEDLLFLRDNLGRMSTRLLARKLRRTYYSVK